MNANQEPVQRPPDEPTPWPNPRQLFWGRLGNDNRPSRRSRWSWYSVALFASGVAAQAVFAGLVPKGLLDGIQVLTSCLAMGVLYWATWQSMQKDLDELHRRITLEATAFSFFLMMMIFAVGIGVLSNIREIPPINMLWVFFTAEPLRGVGLVLAVRKYR